MNDNTTIDIKEDSELFESWVNGNDAAFTTIYNKYKKRIFGFLIKMTNDRSLAEDLLQETFLAALRNSHQFDRRRSLLSWFFGIAHKKTIDYYRHVKVENNHQSDIKKSIGTKHSAPDETIENNYIRSVISDAIQTLDPQQKSVFLLREAGGIAFKDIAIILNCPINTALGRMRLALKNIRKELEKRGIHGV